MKRGRAVAGMLLVAGCTCATSGGWGQTAFDVSSIRPTDPNFGGWKLQYTVDGLEGRGVTLRMLLEDAYGMYEDDRVQGLPAWATEERFDVQAKVGEDDAAKLRDMPLAQRRAMFQALLAERFGLKLHRDTKLADVFALVVGKNGVKFQKAASDDAAHSGMKGFSCLFTKAGLDFFVAKSCTVQDITGTLRSAAGRTVLDETGFTERYDFELHWSPDEVPASYRRERNEGPPLFTAVQQQLGLKLVPAKRPIEFLVVDRVQQPTQN